jgi:hypothetical protein
MNWKDELNEYFIKNEMFRVKYLNEMLFEFLKEYVLFISEYNGIKANLKPISTPLFNDIKIALIEIVIDTTSGRHGFKIECYFNNQGNLFLKYPYDYSYKGQLSAILNPELKKDDYHLYNEEEISEEERIEKEFIFQLLNTRIIKYIEAEKLSRHS